MAEPTHTDAGKEIIVDRGLPAGVTADNINPGEGRVGNKAPVINNEPPTDETEEDALNEQHIDPNAKPKQEDKTPEPEDKKPEDTEEDKKADEPSTEYPVYGDEAADSVVAILKDAGVEAIVADAIFRKAAETNDLNQVDMKTLIEKVGKEKANLIMFGVREYYNKNLAAVNAVKDAVFNVFDGQENFEKVKTWANQREAKDEAFAAQMNEYRKLFDTSAVAATLAAKELRAAYEADANNKSLVTKIVNGDKSASTQVGEKYLTRAEYNVQIKAAYDKNDTQEINRLNSARNAAIKAGY